jgi:hypothetical protein
MMDTKSFAFGLAVAGSGRSLNSAFRERVSRIAPMSAGFRGELCPLSGQSAQPAGVPGYVSGDIQGTADISKVWFVQKTHQGSEVSSGTG